MGRYQATKCLCWDIWEKSAGRQAGIVEKMLVIGLTGNFGSGKTTVAKMLSEHGAMVINADELGHELFQSDDPIYHQVVAAFGTSILKPDGEIDRQKLGALVFDDATLLARLNQITHPRICEMAKRRIEEYRRAGVKVVVLEAALLIEADWTCLVDEVWVTTAPETTIVKRLRKSRGLSEQQILTRLRSQMPQEKKARLADVVIDTDRSMEELRTKVAELWRSLSSSP